MGTWGPAIQSNDTSADIYYLFFDRFQKGHDVKEISAQLISENQDTIADEDDSANFWLALAKAQWETGQLDPLLLEQRRAPYHLRPDEAERPAQLRRQGTGRALHPRG